MKLSGLPGAQKAKSPEAWKMRRMTGYARTLETPESPHANPHRPTLDDASAAAVEMLGNGTP